MQIRHHAFVARGRRAVLCGALALLLAPGAAAAGTAGQEERLSLPEARAYMLELINRDRASRGLKPVRLDPVATEAGQRHAEEMAVNHYLAHWDMAGRLPDQRYTEAGGTGRVQENVYLQMGFRGAEPSGALTLNTEPTFTRREIEDIQAAYFNEVPPDDGHRRNILDAQHASVGIALARAGAPFADALANTQEFVNDSVEVDPIPRTAAVGARVTVSGRATGGARFRSVQLSRGPMPRPMTVEELKRTRRYGTPLAFVAYWPEPYVSPRPVQVTRDGRFQVDVALSDAREPGVYYVTIWLRSAAGRDFVGSQRTVVVK